MNGVLRAMIIYAIVWGLFRITGRRTFAQMTSFDFVLLLIISESVQQGLLGDDQSLTNAIILVATLLAIDLVLSIVKQRSSRAERVIDGQPVLLCDRGTMQTHTMAQERIDHDDLLNAARSTHGLERLDQIKYAVLERNGKISIIPNPTVAE